MRELCQHLAIQYDSKIKVIYRVPAPRAGPYSAVALHLVLDMAGERAAMIHRAAEHVRLGDRGTEEALTCYRRAVCLLTCAIHTPTVLLS